MKAAMDDLLRKSLVRGVAVAQLAYDGTTWWRHGVCLAFAWRRDGRPTFFEQAPLGVCLAS